MLQGLSVWKHRVDRGGSVKMFTADLLRNAFLAAVFKGKHTTWAPAIHLSVSVPGCLFIAHFIGLHLIQFLSDSIPVTCKHHKSVLYLGRWIYSLLLWRLCRKKTRSMLAIRWRWRWKERRTVELLRSCVKWIMGKWAQTLSTSPHCPALCGMTSPAGPH